MPDWSPLQAPSLDDVELLATAALGALPAPFGELTRDIVCIVADFAEDDVLDELGIEDPFELMGLFTGIGLTDTGLTATGQMPNRVWLYRRAILDYWAEHEEPLGAVVTHVLVHELGHHFGFSDADMEAIEAAAEA
jgi:predicted Zn-dependent protease with MMP-like domain